MSDDGFVFRDFGCITTKNATLIENNLILWYLFLAWVFEYVIYAHTHTYVAALYRCCRRDYTTAAVAASAVFAVTNRHRHGLLLLSFFRWFILLQNLMSNLWCKHLFTHALSRFSFSLTLNLTLTLDLSGTVFVSFSFSLFVYLFFLGYPMWFQQYQIHTINTPLWARENAATLRFYAVTFINYAEPIHTFYGRCRWFLLLYS